jgi:putative ABC transport system permease protein
MILTIAFRNIFRNGRRTAMCIIAVTIAVFFTIVMQSMILGMIDSIDKVVQVFDTGHISIVSEDYEAESEYMPVQYPVANGMPFDVIKAEIAAIPGVKAVFPRISAYATLQDATVKHAMLVGMDIPAETAINSFNQTDKTDGIIQGRYPDADKNECAIGKRLAEKGGFKIGDKLPLKTVSAQYSDKMWAPVITGIFSFDYLKYDQEAIIVDYQRLQRLLVLDGATQQVFIFVHNPNESKAIAAEVSALFPNDSVHDWQDNYFVAVMQQSMAIFVFIEFIFMIVASFLIINTVVMIIHERIKEIGMMGSLGMSRREIVQVFFCESLCLAFLGSLAGALLGGLFTGIASHFPFDFTAATGGGFEEFPMSGSLFFVFDPAILLQGFIFGIIVAGICTLIPSLKSAFVEPVEALRR